MKELRILNSYIWKYKYRLLLGIFFIIASNFFKIMTPKVVSDATNEIVSYEEKTNVEDITPELKADADQELKIHLRNFVGLMLLFAFFEGVFLFFTRQTIIINSRKIEYDLRNDIYQHYQELDTAFYKRNKTGDLMSRITEDVNRVRMYLGPAIMYGINLTVLIIISISAMLMINVRLTLCVIAPLPFLSISIFYVNQLINKHSEEIQAKLSDLTAFAQETFAGIRVVKSYVQEKFMRGFFSKESDVYKEKSLKLARIEALFFPLMLLLTGTSTILTVYVGGLEYFKGNINLGQINQFILYLIFLTWPITAIGWVASIIQRASASQKRINEFLRTKPQIPVDVGEEIDVKGKIEFKEVDFTYPDTGIHALKKVSFTIKPGERWAVVGRTGSGKSTITDLLLRMYDPQSGQILADDVDIKTLNAGKYRRQIGYVPQDTFLFSDTITNNIEFGKNGSDTLDTEAVTKMASVHEDILGFSEGYDTVVGERGVTLSGGQKQRISIARALKKDPKIIVLDDCLSAVDAKTEKVIIGKLDEFLHNRTSLIITHRIFALLNFDNIIVLENGVITEQGTHEELIRYKGFYAELFEKQQAEEEN